MTRCSNEYRMRNYIESTRTHKQWNAREWDPLSTRCSNCIPLKSLSQLIDQ